MNHRNRLGHRMSAATILALLSPALVADSFAHTNVPKEDDDKPVQEVAVIEPAQARLSYPVDVSKFIATPAQPPSQPYLFAPPAYEISALVPRRRKGRTPWRKAQLGW